MNGPDIEWIQEAREVDRLRNTAALYRDERDKLRAENERLRAALKKTLHAHDGSHGEDCDAFGTGADDDECDECDCGALKGRNEARAVLASQSESSATKEGNGT